MPDEYVLVLTTLPASANVAAFARRLVADRLVACANLFGEMTSVYRWEGVVAEARERQILLKTSRARLQELRERVHELHPYDVPEFVVVPIGEGSDAYLRWIGASTRPT